MFYDLFEFPDFIIKSCDNFTIKFKSFTSTLLLVSDKSES